MAAPSPTTRVDPVSGGIPLYDGFSTKVTVSGDTDIAFFEKSITPPSIDGGEAIDITTMFNSTWRTKVPRSLMELGDVSVTAAYDPVLYTELQSVINVNCTITVEFSDGSTLAFFGYVRTADFQEVSEGEQPEIQVTITPTNWDPANFIEAGPAVAETAGT